MFDCIWGVFALNSHVEMGKTIVQSIDSKHLGIVIFWGSAFASPSGRTRFRKTHPKQNLTIGLLNLVRQPYVPADVCMLAR